MTDKRAGPVPGLFVFGFLINPIYLGLGGIDEGAALTICIADWGRG